MVWIALSNLTLDFLGASIYKKILSILTQEFLEANINKRSSISWREYATWSV